MIDARIGRLLVASLHQAITELLPTRIEFYEEWLRPSGMRDGRIGLAPVQAVLSFLRLEGAVYDPVVERAGRLAAEWWLGGTLAIRRSAAASGPLWFRGRVAMGLCRDLVQQTFRNSQVATTWQRGEGQITLGGSVFCDIREPVGHALCGFYVAAMSVMLREVGLASMVAVTACRATGGGECVFTVRPSLQEAP